MQKQSFGCHRARSRDSRAWRAAAGLGILLIIALGLTACGSSESSSSGSTTDAASEASGSGAAPVAAKSDQIGKGLTVGMVAITNCSNPAICTVLKAFEAEAKALGAKPEVLEWSGATGSEPVNASISNMDQLIAQKVDGIVYWPIDPTAGAAPLERAAQAHIPVFGFDAFEANNPNLVSITAEGRALQAKQAAEVFCKANPNGGEVLYGDYALPVPSLVFLKEKFTEFLQQCSGGNITIAGDFQNETDDVAGGRKAAEPALQSHPKVVGVEDYSDQTAIGASEAAEALGMRENLIIAGYNLAPEGVSALEAGRMNVSWDYQAALAGQLVAKQLIEYVAGKEKKPSKLYTVWPRCYTPETIGERPSDEELIEQISSGHDLAEENSEFVQASEQAVEPGGNLPNCPSVK